MNTISSVIEARGRPLRRAYDSVSEREKNQIRRGRGGSAEGPSWLIGKCGSIKLHRGNKSIGASALLTNTASARGESSMERQGDCGVIAEEQKHELSQGQSWPSGEQGAPSGPYVAYESAHSTGHVIAARESAVTKISLKDIAMMVATRRSCVDRVIGAPQAVS